MVDGLTKRDGECACILIAHLIDKKVILVDPANLEEFLKTLNARYGQSEETRVFTDDVQSLLRAVRRINSQNPPIDPS